MYRKINIVIIILISFLQFKYKLLNSCIIQIFPRGWFANWSLDFAYTMESLMELVLLVLFINIILCFIIHVITTVTTDDNNTDNNNNNNSIKMEELLVLRFMA